MRRPLLRPLGRVFRGEAPRLKEHRLTAAGVLADYAADQPELLADLLLDADAKQFAVLWPVLQTHREQAIARMRAREPWRQPDYWKRLLRSTRPGEGIAARRAAPGGHAGRRHNDRPLRLVPGAAAGSPASRDGGVAAGGL